MLHSEILCKWPLLWFVQLPSGSLEPLISRQVVYHLAYLRYFASSSGFRKLLNYFQKNLWNSVFTDSLAFSFPVFFLFSFFKKFCENQFSTKEFSFLQILWNSVKNQFSTKEFSYPLFHKFCEIQFSTFPHFPTILWNSVFHFSTNSVKFSFPQILWNSVKVSFPQHIFSWFDPF